MADKNRVQKVTIHGVSVIMEFQTNGQTVYKCPWNGCNFTTSYPCDSDDVECRLDAYVAMHDHLKAHTLKDSVSQ